MCRSEFCAGAPASFDASIVFQHVELFNLELFHLQFSSLVYTERGSLQQEAY